MTRGGGGGFRTSRRSVGAWAGCDGHGDHRAEVSKTVMGVIRPSRVRIPPPPLVEPKRGS